MTIETHAKGSSKHAVLWIGADPGGIVQRPAFHDCLDVTGVWSTDVASRLGLSSFDVIILAYSEPVLKYEAARYLLEHSSDVPVLVLVSAADAFWLHELRASRRLTAIPVPHDGEVIDWGMRLVTHVRWLAANACKPASDGSQRESPGVRDSDRTRAGT